MRLPVWLGLVWILQPQAWIPCRWLGPVLISTCLMMVAVMRYSRFAAWGRIVRTKHSSFLINHGPFRPQWSKRWHARDWYKWRRVARSMGSVAVQRVLRHHNSLVEATPVFHNDRVGPCTGTWCVHNDSTHGGRRLRRFRILVDLPLVIWLK